MKTNSSAILISPDIKLDNVPITPKNGTNFSLKELYNYLDCDYIEVLRLSKTKIMIVDEEGRFKKLLNNDRATFEAVAFLTINIPDYHIVGPVIICDQQMLK